MGRRAWKYLVSKGPRPTDEVRVRFLRLGFSFAAVALLSASTCPTSADDPGCGPSATFNFSFDGAAEALSSADLETSFSGGVRTFSWSRLVENVCSDEHVKAEWTLQVQADKLPPGWRVDAGYLITALLGRDLTFKTTEFNNLRRYEADTEIGLSQSFEDEPGRFLIFLDVAFTSQGDVTDDRAVVQRLFDFIKVTATYKQAKTN